MIREQKVINTKKPYRSIVAMFILLVLFFTPHCYAKDGIDLTGWEQVKSDVPTGMGHRIIEYKDVVYFATDKGVFRLVYSGNEDMLIQVGDKLKGKKVLDLAVYEGKLYAFAEKVVYSTENGDDWVVVVPFGVRNDL